MNLSLGFSPCPNDTFIFDAMVHGRIDTEGLNFDYLLADIEELNRKAFKGEPDITKISSFAYAFTAHNYLILDSGSALGYKNGPLLIGKHKIDTSKLSGARIAIPGKYTTANMLFSIAWPEALNKTELVFSEIENAILNETFDAGLIIHESRFTYQKKGLIMIADMGEFWKELTGFPIPLGMIAINRRVPRKTALKVNRIIQKSLEYAYLNPNDSYDFMSKNAQEMKRAVMRKHIDLYVNSYTSNLGAEGRKAITELYRIGRERGIIPEMPEQIFLTINN